MPVFVAQLKLAFFLRREEVDDERGLAILAALALAANSRLLAPMLPRGGTRAAVGILAIAF